VEDTVGEALTEPNPAAIILGGVSVIYALTGVVTGAMALDPPDGNFTTVFQPVNEAFSVAGATAVDDALLTDSVNFLDDNLTMLIASERYQGAILAGDTVGAALQSSAYNTAQTNSLADAAAVSSDLANFSAELTSLGFQDEPYDGSGLAATQTYLNSVGSSDPFLTN
jgi:hypothetical protein